MEEQHIVFIVNASDPNGTTPELTVVNNTDPNNDPIHYIFELYSDKGYENLVTQNNIPETSDFTSWQVTEALDDNTWYYWRVRATDQKIKIDYFKWIHSLNRICS